jgi:membrane peptidoglycan carboxypeptidase
MIRAARETLLNDNMQGGSTITQQLIKNVLLTPERTLSRKLKEAVLALLTETKYSKEEILELYLNNVPYGGNAWGIQSAAGKYFGKDVSELTLGESALLAGLPPAPSEYSPLINPEGAKKRQKFVLDKMVSLGHISEDQAKTAYEEEIRVAEHVEYIQAPHFVEYIREQLDTMYGKRFVENGGLTVVTTLDLDVQKAAQEIVTSEVERNLKLNITNGAAVVLGVDEAEILAYVGSVDYFKDEWGRFDVASASRQPGSSIKVLTYSLAFAQGMKPTTKIVDKPTVFNIKGSKPYIPVNYDGKFHGEMTLRDALANSYNVPAVQLASKVGPDNIVKLGREMGLKDWAADGSYGLSITLGGEEVRLVDLANVYATLARSGTYKELSGILYIEDSRGYNIYEKQEKEGKKVLDEKVTEYIWNILSDNNARLPAFGTRNFLSIDNAKVAVKTGTTDEKRDNWTFGYSDKYVVGVWVGNNDNSPMNKSLASGLSGAAPIWNRIMTHVVGGGSVQLQDTSAKVSSLHKPEQIP